MSDQQNRQVVLNLTKIYISLAYAFPFTIPLYCFITTSDQELRLGREMLSKVNAWIKANQNQTPTS